MIVVLDDPTTGGASACAPRSCPDCSGRLRSWGYARPRAVRGRRLLVRPQRVSCAGRRVTHVLLAKAAGHGHRRIAADLDLPAATVRGWIRCACARAETIRARAVRLLVELDPLAAALNPTGSALGDALDALGAAVAAAIRRLGPLAPPWQLAASISDGLPGPARHLHGS